MTLQSILTSVFRLPAESAHRVVPPPPPPASVVAPPPVAPAAPAASPAAALSVAAKREKLRKEIAECARLPDDWDGWGGHAAAKVDVENALAFIPRIPDAGIAGAEVYAVGDGEIGFCWRNLQHHIILEIAFEDEGEYTFLSDSPSGGKDIWGEGKYDPAAGLPENLRQVMDAIFAAPHLAIG